ncbi:ligase-associated DNA damage response exonuclease [Pseudochrobactrum sp. sp1633]|uniref:ligase-associated DNA damage response exonuclease n=1 Tax=Pseudochrobactrum sp. sp1633 TaxID=3036706 RepID=UPI0025A55A4E|nr:ligase-associated DNA damage response exonuclease [Pseudochrobactrum sp. sp1633]MDM8346558.1 ligase-associated DNA damage response exonuclease [Pseudochrobactrum sp. sp1633]HWD12668.1 ligase-associated DNA damage response exonuclease [Pseudochrobactrum sp.]
MRPEELLYPAPQGLYCPAGDFYIDPVRPVDRALITHGHADHARAGSRHVLATSQTLDIMRIRFGKNFAQTSQIADYGKPLDINGVKVTFYPAGHVLGSAQIAVEYKNLRIVASGDYKRVADKTCLPFEPVACDIFITEATFGLPVFRHPRPEDETAKLLHSLQIFPERSHIVGAYALGKAQRVISLVRQAGYDAPIYIHGALEKLCSYYQSQGIVLGDLRPATLETAADKQHFAGALILAPPSALADRWSRRFNDPVSCYASGWMRIRQRAKQSGIELPLILSDHCDWDELTNTITELSPAQVWVTHGREEALVRWCALNNTPAKPLHLVGYEDEGDV